MKKVLSLFLILAIFPASVFFADAKKSVYANSPILIEPVLVDLEETYNSCDISYMDENIIFLTNGSPTVTKPQILGFGGHKPILLSEENTSYNYLCGYNNEYFYATQNYVYSYNPLKPEQERHEKINLEPFNCIADLVVSSESLFLIDSGAAESSIYKYNNNSENPGFNLHSTYNYKIEKFAYSEVSKNSFIYDGERVIIEGDNNEVNEVLNDLLNIVEMLCDFEGNLFMFKETEILRYSYETDYSNSQDYKLDFETVPERLISATFNQNTGEFALLYSFKFIGKDINIIYKIPRNAPNELNELNAKTSTDIPAVQAFENLKLSNLEKLYAAIITDYPSNRLYPADIEIGGKTENDGEILEIPVYEKVLVFSVSGKFSFILYKDKFAKVYNNSLTIISEATRDFENYIVLLNRSKIYSCPSNFIYKENQEYSFIIDEIEKNAVVEVISEIEFYGVTYCKINYDNNKTGYINKAEISEPSEITDFNPIPGRIDSNKDIPLYKNKDILSEQLVMLSHKQKIEILNSGDDLYYIKVIINGEPYWGFVESKYVLTDGLTKLQIIGLWILLSAVALAVIAILLRVFIIKRKKLSP